MKFFNIQYINNESGEIVKEYNNVEARSGDRAATTTDKKFMHSHKLKNQESGWVY